MPIGEARAQPDKDSATLSPNAGIMATLPEMRRGRVAAALVKLAGRIKRPGSPLWGYASGHSAYAAAQGGLAHYRILERQGQARILRAREDVEGHYGQSTYAHGTGSAGGMTDQARPLLREMARIGMILDLAHLADQSFWEALDVYAGPVIASHQNCRSLTPGERQSSDEQLRAVVARGGVIGASMDTWMLYADGGLDWAKAGVTDRRAVFERGAVTLEHVADHIDHVCQLAGNAQHAALGGGTDGQGGAVGAPADVDTVADYQKLESILARRGYAQADIEGICLCNWVRFYARWLPARR